MLMQNSNYALLGSYLKDWLKFLRDLKWVLYEEALSQGSIKFLGGRILKPEQLQNVSVYDAARYTYVDGKIPVWINLYFEGYDKQYSYIRVVTSTTLTKKEGELYDMPEGTKQFHILIPSIDIKE